MAFVTIWVESGPSKQTTGLQLCPAKRPPALRFDVDFVCKRSEGPQRADSVEKHRVVSVESRAFDVARAPFLSGFSHLLRCRKDLG